MKLIKDYIKAHKYSVILLYWIFHSVWYELLRIGYLDDNVLLIESPLDADIPFCEWFIIPYCTWYFCIAAIVIYPLFKSDRREFLRSNLVLMGAMLIPMFICTFVPNGIDMALRPDFDSLGRDNILIDMVKIIYNADTPPRNVMPSMHVSISFAMFFVILQSKTMCKSVYAKILSGIWCVMISASTVFIKQHSILDVYAGIAVAVVVALIGYIGERIYDKTKENKKGCI
ncbi:MAG: phosphatase PAP2 family protein [Clostridia bacterium]|nr:phosphatase PAP2 family protein [Clostridia bacterium]